MNKLYDAIDRFCARHPYWGIPNLMRYMVIGTVVMYVLCILTQNQAYVSLSLVPGSILRGEVWRLVTFIFLPLSTSPLSLLISLYFYYWMGNMLENYWGTPKFTIYYLSGIVLTVLASFLAHFLGGGGEISGLHYVNMSMFLAYATLYPDARVYLFYLIPVRIKWLAWLDLAYFAVGVLSSIGYGDWGGALAPVVALLNFFVYFAPYFTHKARVVRHQSSRQTVNFKKAVREQRREKGYNHKCEICGRTDTDYPDLQFRYCSTCGGYHCSCEDHISHPQHHQ